MDRSVEHDQEQPEVPPGYHFTPTPEELVHFYLNRWITGQPLGELENIVRHADVYTSEPTKLMEEHMRFGHAGTWYFFSVAKWKGTCKGTGGRFNHRRRRPVDGCGDGCGRLGFEYRDANNGKTDWLMEELTSNLPEATSNEGVKVICKVYLTPRERQETKRSPLHRPEKHEVGCSNAAVGGGGMSQATTVPTDYELKPIYNGGYGGVVTKTVAKQRGTTNGKEERRQETNVLESKRHRLDQQEHQLLPEAGCSNAIAGVTAADSGTTEATISTCYYLTFTTDDNISISAYDGGPDDVPTMSTEEEASVPSAISESATASKIWYDQTYGIEAAPDHGGTWTQPNQSEDETMNEFDHGGTWTQPNQSEDETMNEFDHGGTWTQLNQSEDETMNEWVNCLLNDDDGDDPSRSDSSCTPQPQMAPKKDKDT
ncbi:hypothetical protein ABZP36_009342 [Zizania latifolia]